MKHAWRWPALAHLSHESYRSYFSSRGPPHPFRASPSRSQRNVTAAVHFKLVGLRPGLASSPLRDALLFFAAHRQGGCRRDQRGCRCVVPIGSRCADRRRAVSSLIVAAQRFERPRARSSAAAMTNARGAARADRTAEPAAPTVRSALVGERHSSYQLGNASVVVRVHGTL